MNKKGLSKILVGTCLVLVLALALPLASACAPAPAPAPEPEPTPAPTPTPTPTPEPAEEVYTLTFNWMSVTGPANVFVFPFRPDGRFQQLLDAETGGRIKFDIKDKLYTGIEAVTAIADGRIDAGNHLTPWISGTYPLGDYGTLPGLFATFPDSLSEWDRAQSDPRMQAILDKYYRESDLVEVGNILTVPQVLWAQKPVRTVEDWQGLKMRASGVTQHGTAKALGGAPITLSVAEIEEAVAKGTVDAIITDLPYGLQRGLSDIISYLNQWEVSPVFSGSVFINAEVFDSLPKDLQDAIKRAGAELRAECVLVGEQQGLVAFLWLRTTKCELVYPDPGELDKMAQLLKPVYEEWLENAGPYGPEVLAIASEYGTGPAAEMAAELAAK